ncbi:MAG: hypothetical protein CM1200mP41_23850 [Gammaproteobacteria bacterium]|nr:MAG: hypothetical protein CM1200mP41_23850 [Gammaproteobacteria bacterium]
MIRVLRYQGQTSSILCHRRVWADRGIVIAIGHQAAQVMDADAVVVSSAVSADNPEIIAARRQGIPVLPRAQCWVS